MFQAYKKVVC